MYFAYIKRFDISRAKHNGIPRLANVTISTFGQFDFVVNADSLPEGWVATQDYDAGIRDLVSYGMAELRNVEFLDLQANEIRNFKASLASDIISIAGRQFDDSGTQTTMITNAQHDVIQNMADRIVGEGFSRNYTLGHLATVSSLRDAARSVIIGFTESLRKASPMPHIAEDSELSVAGARISRHTLRSSEGFQDAVMDALAPRVDVTSLAASRGYSSNGIILSLDNTRRNSRYIRYIQFLAHRDTPLRLHVRTDPRQNLILVRPIQDFSYSIHKLFDVMRELMPEGSIQDPTVQQKLMMVCMAACRNSLYGKYPHTITDEHFVNPELDATIGAMGSNASEITFALFGFGDVISPHVKGILEASWTISKLRASSLASTSLNFPELGTYLASRSDEQ